MSIIQEIRNNLRYRRAEMQRIRAWEPHVPQMGAMAPDFTLTDSTGQHTVTLSQLLGQKPVALVFGSFT
ncbi:MAG: hypothetical protein Fur0018_09390 [Anaerolineales bacterium]